MKFLVYIFLTFSFLSINAQDNRDNSDSSKKPEVFKPVEVMPEFKGGFMEMMKYIQKSMIYPKKEKNEKIGGIAGVKFVVEANGELSNIVIGQSSGNENLDKEALRIVSSMPKWEPGKQQGRPVSVNFNLPIKFRP